MRKIGLGLVVLLLLCTAAWADPVTLTATAGVNGGKDVYTLTGVTFGSTLTFEYQFLNVTWVTNSNFLNVNGKALENPFPDYNDYQNAPTALLTGTVDTSGLSGIGDVAFTADTFNSAGNSVTILIQNVRVDGVLVGLSSAAVPEPSSLLFLGTGLAGFAFRRLRKR